MCAGVLSRCHLQRTAVAPEFVAGAERLLVLSCLLLLLLLVAVCAIQFTRVGGVDVELCGRALPAKSDAEPDEPPRVELTCKVQVSVR